MSLSIEIQPDPAQLAAIQKKLQADVLIGGPLKRQLGKATLIVQREITQATPVQTGRLRASIVPKVDASPVPLWGKVETGITYAPDVEHGGMYLGKYIPARHVEPMGGKHRRVFGKGMFAYGWEKTKAKVEEMLDKLSKMIEDKFNK